MPPVPTPDVRRPSDGSVRFLHILRRAADAMGRADIARRARPSSGPGVHPRPAAGPGAPCPASFARRLPRAAAGLLAGLLLAAATLVGGVAQAQDITLISNFGQFEHNSAASVQSQPFTTGGNANGYVLASVKLAKTTASDAIPTVRIVPNASNGEPDLSDSSKFIVLTSPSTFPVDSTATFTAPANTTLARNTTYHVHAAGDSVDASPGPIQRTTSTDEDSGGADGWSIGNTRYWKNVGATSWETSTNSMVRLEIVGRLNTTTLSDDATLDSLAVADSNSNAVSLTPAFDSATMTYTAEVANTVTEITLTAGTTDDGASVTAVTLDGTAISDTDFSDGIISVTSLVVGDNTIVVTVTAENNDTETYTVTVTRAAAVTPAQTVVAADWSLIPSGLSTGDSFRLIFGTSLSRNATSGTIADYNTFVQNRAAAGHSAIQTHSSGFRVVGCTADVDARDNTSTTYTTSEKGVPVYWLDGNKVADDYEDFYDGSWDDEANPTNESGTARDLVSSNRPFTGCGHNGTEAFSGADSRGLGATTVQIGSPNSTNSADGPLSSGTTIQGTNFRPFYGLSPVFKVAASDDATLASLAVADSNSNAVSLIPAFVSATMTYTASVANTVSQIELTAATTDDDADVTAVTLNGTAIGDTVFTDGISVPSLIVGVNTVVVTVTAENSDTETYTVTVTRANPPVQAVILVSNIGQDNDSSGLAFASFDLVQGFRTGSASATLDSIGIKLTSEATTDQAASAISAKLFKDNPTGTPVATLTSTDTITADSTGNYTFAAPANTTLDASTTYHVLFESSLGNIDGARTSKDAEDSGGADGWSIANGHRWRNAPSTGNFTNTSEALMIRVNGTEILSDDATLDSLAVEDSNGNAVSLTPAFDSATTTYTASVARTVTEIELTAATTDDGASVTGVTLDGTAIADIDFSDGIISVPSLIVGANTVVVTVTAENTTDTETYTVRVTRAEDCATDRPHNDWCATMTVGVWVDDMLNLGQTFFGFLSGSHGLLDKPTIVYGPSFEVERIYLDDVTDPNESEDVVVRLDAHVPLGTVFNLGGTEFTVDTVSRAFAEGWHVWDRPANFVWIEGQEVTVSANLAPLLESAALDGTSLTLTYAEDLDTNSVPAADAFEVDVDGADGPEVTGVAVSGNTVTLTLATELTGTDVDVTLDYEVPSSNPLQDVSGLDAPALDGFEVDISAARGQPTITGTPQVGMELTAGQGDIADTDGLPGNFANDYTFQWVRVGDMDTETDIGSDSHIYTPVAADVGNSIRVEVSFTDGANNPEGPLASDPTATVVAAAGVCAADSDWRATLMMGYQFSEMSGQRTDLYGFDSDEAFGGLVPDMIRLGSADYAVTQLMRQSDIGLAGDIETTVSDFVWITVSGSELPDGTRLNLGETALTVGTDSATTTAGQERWNLVSLGLSPTWVGGQEQTVCANLAPLLARAVVVGTTLTLTYAEALDTGSVPAASAYTVKVNGAAGPAVTGVSVSGNTVTLTLATAITVLPDTVVTLDYELPTSNPLQDLSGLDAPMLSNQAVETDPRGAVLTPPALEVTEGATESYTVALTEAPTGPVTVAVGVSGAGVRLSTASLTFTTTDWGTAKRVEVTALEDDNAVDEEVTLSHTPSGGGYDDVTLPDLVVTVADNDGGIEADTAMLTVAEGGISPVYTLKLTRRPTSDVTVKVRGDAGKVGLSKTTLTFTPEDWDQVQLLSVGGLQDSDKNDEVVTLRHTATGGGYSVTVDDGARAAPVRVTVEDDEATAPGAPGLTASGANESAVLRWDPPGDNGGAPVTGYQYRRDGGAAVDVPDGADVRTVTVPGLANGTEYSFEVRALNRVGEGDWSTAQTATPIPLTLTVEAVSEEVTEGEPVRYRIVMSECADWVNVKLVYAHEGEFMRFAPSSSGQGIRCVGGEKAWEIERGTVDDDDIEAHGSFTVTLRPGDGYGLGTPSSATIRILDNDGGTAPGAPPRPAVSVVSPRILDATWRAAPDNGAALTGYALEYREGTAGPWTRWPEAIAPDTRSVRIGALSPDTAHQVRVRAKNVRGDGPWSTPGEARTAPDPGVRVSIARPDNSSRIGTEGDTLAFTVNARPAPASALRVDVRVTETLETILGRTPTSVTVPAGRDSVSFEVRTEDDDEDESHYSRVTAELLPSVRYVLEQARTVTYTVIDNDADTERGRPLRPRVEAIEDPNTRPQVREVAEDPVVTLRLTWGAPADIPLAQVRGWLVEWSNVDDCSVQPPTDESWPGGGNIEVESREFLHRPRNAAHLRVAAILVGDGIGQWSETVCGDVGDFVPEPDEEPGPSVTSVSVAPDPNRNGRWTPGEALTVSVGFSDTVAVLTADGTPSIRVYTDTGARDAVYSRGSGTAVLTFVYTISDTDETVLSVVVAPNSLALNGGAIVGRRGRAAVLEHEQAERSGTPPAIVRSVQGTDTETDTETDTSEGKDSDPPEKAEPPSVSVADAEVREGPGAALQFAVRLSRAASDPVTVGYRSTDKSATAGQDYRAVSGTLRFAPGETTKRVRVEVLDDVHDEGREVMLLVLISAEGAGATLADSVAEGTIENTDPMPRAWLGRFGRTASDHAIGAIESRFAEDAAAQPQSHLTVGGRRLDEEWRRVRTALDWERVRAGFDAGTDAPAPPGGHPPDPRLKELSPWERMDRLKTHISLAGGSPAVGSPAVGSLAGGGLAPSSAPEGGGLAGEDTALRSSGEAAKGKLRGLLTELLGLSDIERLSELSDIEADPLNTSFFYSGALDGNGRPRGPQWLGQWSAWGQSAATRFAGAEGELSVNGEVTTATVGFDTRRERLMAGVALAYSEGQGAFALPGASGGAIASALTSLHPFAQYRINERASVWGVVGHGTGALTLTPQGAPAGIEADLSTSMAAFGGRGVLSVRSAGEAKFEIALRSDARFTNTVSDAVEHLGGATGATSRVRLVVEGRGSLPLLGGVLSPTLEAGLRHDDGDAERGAGLEIGGGLAYASGRLSVALNARGLLAHRDEAYREWGVSGSVRFTPRKDGRGLSVDLGSTWGVAQSGVQSLWSAGQASDLARAGAFEAGQRFQAQLAYGFDGRKGRARWQPYLKADAGENGTAALGFGLKMTSGEHIEAGLEIGTNAPEPERLHAGGLERGLHGPRSGAADASGAAIRLQGSLRW